MIHVAIFCAGSRPVHGQFCAPIEATIEGSSGELVPVSLHARLDEVGTLQLSCVERDGGKAHKLAYNLRERDGA